MRTTSCYFVGYPEKSKGYRFYCPNAHTRLAESNNAKFIEDGGALYSHSRNIYVFEQMEENNQSFINGTSVLTLATTIPSNSVVS